MSYQSNPAFKTSTPNTQTFQEIEQFSKELCEELAKAQGDHYRQPEVIYGLAAFLTAVRQALKNPDHNKQILTNTKQLFEEKHHG